MRSLLLVLLAAAALVAPTTALAAGGATSPPSRAFVITGLALGDKKMEASGKIAIDGGRLIASVGCNTIGGTVTLDGDTVTIPQALAMTEMACLGVDGDTEAMLIKILQAGPFTIAGGAWTGRDAAILVEELPAGQRPGASIPPSDDGVVSSSPDTGTPPASCQPVPAGTNATTPADGGPIAGSGSGGGTSTGGGDGSAGSGSAPAATAVDLPAATTIAEPGATPDTGPAATIAVPPPSGPVSTPTFVSLPIETGSVSGKGVGTDPGVGADPGVGKPIDRDPCADRMSVSDQANAGGAGIEPPKTSDAAAEHFGEPAGASVLVPIGIGLGIALLVGFLGLRRARSARPSSPAGGGASGAV